MINLKLNICCLIFLLVIVAPSMVWSFDYYSNSEGKALKGWPEETVGYSIVIGLTPSNIDYQDYARCVMRAFNTWTAIPEAGINLEYRGLISVTDNDDPETYYSYRDFLGISSEGLPMDTGETNVIACRNSLEASGYSTYVLSYCPGTYEPSSLYFSSGDIFLNTNPELGYTWSIGPQPGKYDIQSVVTHEVGHLIGMVNSDEFGATMYMTPMTNDDSATVLHQDDINGAVYLYPRDASYVSGSAPTPSSTYTDLRNTTTGLWPDQTSLPIYGPEPVIVDPDTIDVSDPLVGGEGGGGGCNISSGQTHRSGFLAPFFLLITFAAINCLMRQRQLT